MDAEVRKVNDNLNLELTKTRKRVTVLEAAIRKETADHKPSVATGLPCKCFLCKALVGG